MAINSYADQATRDIHFDINSRHARTIPQAIWPVARRKLNAIDAATSLADLSAPGMHLEKLRGDLAGRHSIRINDQYRITFLWSAAGADDVKVCDYHQ
ncbi:MAG TPA: type II toxin-antitoxin system RelE/ParE family toxin [Polyangiaceae bacterium]